MSLTKSSKGGGFADTYQARHNHPAVSSKIYKRTSKSVNVLFARNSFE